jgi:hypothetical protein
MSMNRNQLESEFVSRAVPHSGGLLLLTPDDALALVRRASEERLPILGIDGMFVSEGETLSPLEYIADFSVAVAQGDGSWSAAKAFVLAHQMLGLVFEVVLGERVAMTNAR